MEWNPPQKIERKQSIFNLFLWLLNIYFDEIGLW